MAYVAYEDIIPKKVNYRIVPRLRKYYRADGTFDLYDITRRQVSCFRYLASKGEAGFFIGRSGGAGWGTYYIDLSNVWSSNWSSLTSLYVSREDHTGYNAVCTHDLLLRIDNSAGLYPYYVYTRNYSDHNAGSGYIFLYNNASQSQVVYAGGGGNQALSKSSTWNSPSTLLDPRDYAYVRLYGNSADGSKYTTALSTVQIYFIHRYNTESLLYRYYR